MASSFDQRTPLAIIALTLLLLMHPARINAQPQPSVLDAWIEAPAAGETTARAFLTVRNPGMYDVWILSGSTDVAAKVELRQGSGSTTTVPKEIGVPPSETLEMKGDGPYLALVGLTRPLVEGETITLVVKTDLAEWKVPAVVKKR